LGIVIQQATQNAIYSYIGAVLGFVTVWLVNVHWLTPEQNGLISLLINISILTGSLSNLGMTGVTMRLFPLFKTYPQYQGFLFYPLFIACFGFIAFLAIYLLSSDWIVARNVEKSALFAEHHFYLVPLTFFWALFNVFDAYSRSVLLSTAGVMIKEVLLRVFILIIAFLYHKNWISFSTFLLLYCGSFCSISIILAAYLVQKNQWFVRPKWSFLTPALKSEMRKVALYSIITGLSSLLISSIDKVIVNDMLGLSAAGIFTVAANFGSMIQIPARSIIRIASPIVAQSWQDNDIENIRKVYYKTCLNQFAMGLFLLAGLFVCIDPLMAMMPNVYAEGKWAILLISLGFLIDMATGVNGVIIATSKYYRFDTYFMFSLVIITAISNILLIPIYGITGAGLACCLTYFLFNLLRYLFIWQRFGMQPYSKSFALILIWSSGCAALAYFCNWATAPLALILIKGCAFSLPFLGGLYFFNWVPDLRQIIVLFLRRNFRN
jgi:O-antigen/teichoic acid export membrane protein